MFGWLRRLRAPRPRFPMRPGRPRSRAIPSWPNGRRPSWSACAQLAAEFLRDKEFHGAQASSITDEVALAIAAQAVLPVLHLPAAWRWYDDFVGIVVHPAEVVARRTIDRRSRRGARVRRGAGRRGHGPRPGDAELAGRAGRRITRGRGLQRGDPRVRPQDRHARRRAPTAARRCRPALPAAQRARGARRWLAVLQPAYDAFREKTIVAERFGGEPPWLDAYGARVDRRVLRRGLRGLLREPRALRAGVPGAARAVRRVLPSPRPRA